MTLLKNLAVILQGLVIHSLAKVAPLRLKFLTCGRPEVVWHKMATVSILPVHSELALRNTTTSLSKLQADSRLYIKPDDAEMDFLCTPALTKFHKIHSDIIGLRRRLKRKLVEGPEGYVEYPRKIELDLRVVRKKEAKYYEIPKKEVKYWEIPIKLLEAVDRLWTWFEKNDDILFRASLKVARLRMPDIVDLEIGSN